MHAISLQRSRDTTRRLAENRAQMCLIGLKEMQKYWEVNNLVLELFFQYIDESTARTLRPSEAATSSDAAPNEDGTRAAGEILSVGDRAVPSFYDNNEELDPPSEYPGLAGGDPLLSESSQSILYESSTSDPFAFFMDSQARINDGLDMQGLQFLQRCL